MTYVIWATLLFIQNFTSAINSRAKNQENLWYTAVTSWLTNASWMASTLLVVDISVKAMKSGDASQMLTVILFYSICTMSGTLVSQWVAMKWVEPWLERRKK